MNKIFDAYNTKGHGCFIAAPTINDAIQVALKRGFFRKIPKERRMWDITKSLTKHPAEPGIFSIINSPKQGIIVKEIPLITLLDVIMGKTNPDGMWKFSFTL